MTGSFRRLPVTVAVTEAQRQARGLGSGFRPRLDVVVAGGAAGLAWAVQSAELVSIRWGQTTTARRLSRA